MAPLLFGDSIMFPFNETGAQRTSEKTFDNHSSGQSLPPIDARLNIKVEKDDDDSHSRADLNHSVHLCNRCWSTFVGIDAYFAHRNNGCNSSKESTNNDAQWDDESSRVRGGTCYINPNFPLTIQNMQRSQNPDNQPIEKDTQSSHIDQESSISKKRNVNMLSPDQSAITLNNQPKKIKMSESSKELSRELAEILRKQMSVINSEYKEKQNSLYSLNANNDNESIRLKLSESVRSSNELNLAESINAAFQKQMENLNKTNNIPRVINSTVVQDHDSPNFDSIENPIEPISFHNEYSAAFNSRFENTKNSLNHTRNIAAKSFDYKLRETESDARFHLKNSNISSDYKVQETENNKTVRFKNSNTLSEVTHSRTRSFGYERNNGKVYNDCNGRRKRVPSFRSKTLLIFNLNIDTRQEWLKKIFQRYGSIKSVKITRHEKVMRAKGFVEFEKLSDAEKAYKLCRNRIIDGSKVKITYYQYSLDCSPSWIGSDTTEFGKEYNVRSTGYPSRRPIYKRSKRPGPYNLF